jgi:hypothetical protein
MGNTVRITVGTKEQVWEMANAIFPADYEKDEDSSRRAGYDIYRHYYTTTSKTHDIVF